MIKEINRLWKEPDEQGKRLMTLAEFQDMFVFHHIPMEVKEASQLFQELDTNHTGLLDYDLFVARLVV